MPSAIVTAAGNVRIYGASSAPTPKLDPSRIHQDFSCTFPTVAVPTPATMNNVTGSWTTTMSLPRAGDLAFNGSVNIASARATAFTSGSTRP